MLVEAKASLLPTYLPLGVLTQWSSATLVPSGHTAQCATNPHKTNTPNTTDLRIINTPF